MKVNDNNNENELMIKIFTGDEQCNTYCFNSDSQKCIIIGRNSSLYDVIKEDKILSRVHYCINFKENENSDKGCFIKDGNLQGKKSTNDTLFYSGDETLVYDEMVFNRNRIKS